ncbi:hypothetical protein PsYK624_025580 [Phanerochaete sordida]|uniref:Uncharacterized protein n=1 Tax=Phanerochaete sordida TaxID=48140 RepID=A0A9P3G040_9APHY|nr:hypothetical protein PsYK624_025580 [Phanerochaete sordida]
MHSGAFYTCHLDGHNWATFLQGILSRGFIASPRPARPERNLLEGQGLDLPRVRQTVRKTSECKFELAGARRPPSTSLWRPLHSETTSAL